MSPAWFRRLAWSTLLYDLAVILWGAFVRATGSGAGCGSHWPDCNGELIPRSPSVETMIEFTHRATSGLALLLTVALFIASFKAAERGSWVRRGAALSLFFMLTEAAVGAGLVLFEYVAQDERLGRGLFMAVHLINTYLLLAANVLTVAWASGLQGPRLKGQRGVVGMVLVSAAAMLLLGVSGAIAALGNTLFPVTSLSEGLAQDFSPTAHLFVRLRLWHPFIAVLTGFGVMIVAASVSSRRPTPVVRAAALSLVIVYGVQLVAGAVNLVLHAPVWLQIVHLLLADMAWAALLVLGAGALQPSVQTEASHSEAPAPAVAT